MSKKFIASFGIITLLLFLLFLLLFKTIQKINNHYITKKNKNIFSKINMKNELPRLIRSLDGVSV